MHARLMDKTESFAEILRDNMISLYLELSFSSFSLNNFKKYLNAIIAKFIIFISIYPKIIVIDIIIIHSGV